MAEIPLLWSSGARKEAMELLRLLWADADPQMQKVLSEAICNGPPKDLFQRIDPEEREKSRDRRIFDRLTVLKRLELPQLSSQLFEEAERLQRKYPNWRAPEGEKAHFSIWMETVRGNETRFSVNDLSKLDNDGLISLLAKEQDMREGLLDSWQQLVSTDMERGVTLLETLINREKSVPVDVWSYGLQGLRNSAKEKLLRGQVIQLLLRMPAEIFNAPEISRGVTEFLQDAASNQLRPNRDEPLLELYDRSVVAAQNDQANADIPSQRDWVFLSINRSMGHVATAFFGILFARDLKVGDGLPADLKPRLNALLSADHVSHRPARVIAASRLSYLHAVDPEWTRTKLIPNFDWSNELEAEAAWEGYGWQPRIDTKLWQALKPNFLSLLENNRLSSLGHAGKNLAQMLMLIGLEFGIDELPREKTREAIRGMPVDLKSQALFWITTYLEQAKQNDVRDHLRRKSTTALEVDSVWETRVWPWIKRVWPPEPNQRSTDTSELFALLAIITEKSFPVAVVALLPYLVRTNGFQVLHKLESTSHPTLHPTATLELIDAVVDPTGMQFFAISLGKILEQIRLSDGTLADSPVYHRWDQRVRAQ